MISVWQGDITTLAVDAIVNAANERLSGGGGVDGAIHRAAGPELLAECRTLGGCPTGEAKATKGYRLPAQWVIHTVGPVWQGGGQGEDDLLADCYRTSVALAVEKDCATVAFPAISTGVYGFPAGRAAGIAVRTLRAVRPDPLAVTLVAFDARCRRRALQSARRQQDEFRLAQGPVNQVPRPHGTCRDSKALTPCSHANTPARRRCSARS